MKIYLVLYFAKINKNTGKVRMNILVAAGKKYVIFCRKLFFLFNDYYSFDLPVTISYYLLDP